MRCVIGDAGETARYRLVLKDDVGGVETLIDEDEREQVVVDTDRYCGVCQQPKPERAHHCSECNT